jgi:beta-phosphoglucomutase-like phosphatase (HAD superfamily)
MFEFLVEFRCRGGLVVVVSHSEVDMIERDYRAASAGLAEAFLPDLVFGWDVDPARRKPSPYPVLAALERFGLPASEALVLDDLKPGLDMAASAGVDCAAAGWGHAIPEIREVMANRCRWYFDTVAEFAGFILGA